MNESFEFGNLVECKNAKCQFKIMRKKFKHELPKNTKIKFFTKKTSTSFKHENLVEYKSAKHLLKLKKKKTLNMSFLLHKNKEL
jgi:hypothetical protein